MNEILEKMPIALKRIKEKKPLTHCITNYVTVNDCANAILAIGATPIMAEDLRELESIVNISSGLVINIGTINVQSMPRIYQLGKKEYQEMLTDLWELIILQ